MALVEASGAADAGGRSDEELVKLHVLYAMTRDKRLRLELARCYETLVVQLTVELTDRPGAQEVARNALMRAIDRYSDRRGTFRTYATTRIRAELRHLDQPTSRAVPALLREDYIQVVRTVEDLTQELGRSPRVSEIAARSGVSEERVLVAMEHLSAHPDDEG